MEQGSEKDSKENKEECCWHQEKTCLSLSASSPLLQQSLSTLHFQWVSDSHKHCQSTAPLIWKQEQLLSTGATWDADSWLLQLSSSRRGERATCGTVMLGRHLRPLLVFWGQGELNVLGIAQGEMVAGDCSVPTASCGSCWGTDIAASKEPPRAECFRLDGSLHLSSASAELVHLCSLRDGNGTAKAKPQGREWLHVHGAAVQRGSQMPLKASQVRIREELRLGRTLKGHLIQPPSLNRSLVSIHYWTALHC